MSGKNENSEYSDSSRLLPNRQLLDESKDSDFDFLLKTVLEYFQISTGWISFLEGDTLWIKSSFGLENGFQSKVIPSFFGDSSENNLIFELKKPGFFPEHWDLLAVPIFDSEKITLGCLVVKDLKLQKLAAPQKEFLWGISRQVSNLLSLHQSKATVKDLLLKTENQFILEGKVYYSCLADTQRTFLTVTEAILPLTGKSKEDILKRPTASLLEFIFEEDQEMVQKEWTEKMLKSQKWELTYRIFTSEGKRKWVLDKGHFKEANGKSKAEGILLDITEQMEAKQFYKTVFDHSDSIICIHDESGALLHFNKAAAESLEYDIKKDKIHSIFQFIRQEDTPYLSYYFDQLHKTDKLSITLRLKSKQNGSVYWLCRVSKLEMDGRPSFMISAWDVTEKMKTDKKLQESENLFRLISENLSDVLYVYDVQTNTFDYISPNTESIIGVEKSYFKAVNNFIEDFVQEDFKEKCKELKANLALGQGYTFEYPIQVHGATLWLNESVHPVKGTEGFQPKFVGRVTNISLRKKNYLELTSTKSILEETGKIALVGGWSFEVETRQLTWTTVTREIHECPEDYVPNVEEGINFYAEGHSRDLIVERFGNLLKTGESFDVEAEIITAKGNRRWVRSIGKGEYINGQIVRTVGIFQDITEKITQIKELERTKQMLESIFNELTDVIWSVSYPDYRLLFASPSSNLLIGKAITEYSAEKSILADFIHPEDVPLALSIQKGIGHKNQYSFIYRIITTKKEVKWVRESGRLIMGPDQLPLRIDGKISDITREIEVQDAMNSQLKLQDILMKIATDYINLEVEKSHNEIQNSLKLIGEYTEVDRAYIFDYEWDKKTCSNTFEWCAEGISAEIENLQEIPLDLIPQWVETHQKKEFMYIENVDKLDDEDELKKILAPQCIKTLITIPIYFEEMIYGFVGFDYVKETKDLSASEISLLLLFAKILANLKNRSVLEKEIIREKNRAEQTSKFKSEFLSNMSHEIRTPLNGVIGFTDLLLRTPLNHTQKQYAENANIAGKSLLGIVSDILDFSKIESGKLDLELIDHDIYEVAYSAIDITKFAAVQKNLELICNIPPDLPPIMQLDPVRLKQVLINLLGNAVKFTLEGEVELKVDFQKHTPTTGLLSFAIRDTGIGISEDQQKKLFKAFSQADSSISRKYGGTGLGLTISNLLVQKMGGNIQLESVEGEGTTFSFCFETSYHEEEKPQLTNSLFKKVLLVDDNPKVTRVLENYLDYWQVSHHSSNDPLEALQLLEKDPTFDLAVVDYRMPGMDGLELIQKARKDLRRVKNQLQFILLHSPLEDESLKKTCHQFEIDLALIKPVDPEELHNYLTTGKPKKELETQNQVDEFPKSGSEKVFHILVAEDIDMNMILIKTLILQQLPKAKIFECSNGEIAIKTFKAHPIDLVIMDVQMPVMDGMAATRKIREFEALSGKRTPIIALTAGALQEEKEKCLEAGMDEFLTKPVQPNNLVKIIERYLLKIGEFPAEAGRLKKEDPSEASLFDRAALLELIGYDMTLFKALMEASLDLESQLKKLEVASENNDRTAIKSIAHGLKGSCQSLYFNSIQGLVRNLEINSEFMESNTIQEIINLTKEEWKLLRPIIEKEIQNI